MFYSRLVDHVVRKVFTRFNNRMATVSQRKKLSALWTTWPSSQTKKSIEHQNLLRGQTNWLLANAKGNHLERYVTVYIYPNFWKGGQWKVKCSSWNAERMTVTKGGTVLKVSRDGAVVRGLASRQSGFQIDSIPGLGVIWGLNLSLVCHFLRHDRMSYCSYGDKEAQHLLARPRSTRMPQEHISHKAIRRTPIRKRKPGRPKTTRRRTTARDGPYVGRSWELRQKERLREMAQDGCEIKPHRKRWEWVSEWVGMFLRRGCLLGSSRFSLVTHTKPNIFNFQFHLIKKWSLSWPTVNIRATPWIFHSNGHLLHHFHFIFPSFYLCTVCIKNKKQKQKQKTYRFGDFKNKLECENLGLRMKM